MTQAQVNDYSKVQDLVHLKMWISETSPDSVKDEELLKLPLRNALSDMEFIIDNAEANDWEEGYEKKVRNARWYLRKYGRK